MWSVTMLADVKRLEFDKIKTILSHYAKTDLGQSVILSIEPMNDKESIKDALEEVEEAKIAILRYDATPLTGVLNLQSTLRKAEIQSMLSIEELMRIVSHQEAIVRTFNYLKKVQLLDIKFDQLIQYYDRIKSISTLKDQIEKIIDKKGEIYDHASPKLAKIRKQIKTSEDRINQVMASLLRSEANKLSDSLITIRNNRLVLPVKAEYKNIFNGVVHDHSSSRETVFMEPMSCFTLNNELQSLMIDEETEIDAILRQLTQEVSEYVDVIRLNLEMFTALDVIYAKAKYACDFDMTKPELTGKVNLINARHPLIEPSVVVGNHIFFGDYKHIIITGPNTGGKTVALKTLGLLAMMAQSGMLIPVDEHSELVVFKHIFSDIGDEQSIEQSLSTFSSHISNITRIFNSLEDNALVLLDEIGSGTDPKEGASLAIAMMNYLRNQKIYSMVTTHYPELKTYAYNLSDTINASVEFDLDTLKPTYKLKIGIPGESNAIKIAKRLGLNDAIVKEAESVSLGFDSDVSAMVKKLEKQSKYLDDQIQNQKSMINDLEKTRETLKQEKKKMIQEYNQKLQELSIENQRKQKIEIEKIDQLIQELNGLRNQADFKEHKLAKIKHERSLLNQKKVSYQKSTHQEINVGDRVHVLPYQRQGIINKQLKSDEYEVQMGVLTVNVKLSELEYAGKAKKEVVQSKSDHHVERQVKVELDLHGKRYVDAMEELDKFIDDCLLNNLEFAYIVHGIGTMALKKGVETYAKNNPYIKQYRSGGETEGGKGVTVVYFK